MQSYSLSCSFTLDYNVEQVTLDLHFSKQFALKYKMTSDQLSLIETEITKFLHRYDYRKLNYFYETGITEVFDTLMRFTFRKCKYPLRTVAVCKVTKTGLKCAHFEEVTIVKLRKSKRLDHLKVPLKFVNIENFEEVLDKQKSFLTDVKAHLVEIIDRDQKIV
ncbi:MAG: hypothetical protein CVV58_03185 [Tenericutes bacterium HGW-Tenericutes-3]|nr:MAG: hypothetical protein CVV58_03185 [Tenericutes bacterium HGW-Tenericutes-3]